jgi:UDP-N-acetylglucosamine transferase subunit ALG13
MIFVTIGTQAPFDRLIEAVDEIALQLNEEIIAQVSDSKYEARNIKTLRFVSQKEFDSLYKRAKLVISHSGTGSILSALTTGKPIVVMPRIAKLGEHRNEHQMATANKFEALGYVNVVKDTTELKELLLKMFKNPVFEPLHYVGPDASVELMGSLREYILSKE